MSSESESGAAVELKTVGDKEIPSDGSHEMSTNKAVDDTPRLDYYEEQEEEDEVRWIKSHVQKKCQYHKYLEPLHTRSRLDDKVVGLNPVCTCGNLRSQHESTDVFGEFEFDNDDNQLARFMKTDDVQLLPQLLTRSQRRWNNPRKLISIVGGNHNILMSKQSKEILRHGFTDIAEKYERNICFVTNGVNTTINRLVGKSCKKMNLLTGSNGYIKLTPVIGVVPWSNIPNKDQLIDRQGKWQFKYSQIYDKNSVNLETNHTDFFFVDDNDEYRMALERQYSIGILLVIRGGTEAFPFIEETIRNGLRIVFIKGFGGVADIVAQVLPLTKDEERHSLLKILIERGTCLGVSYCGEELQQIMDAVENIVHHKKSVAVYDLSSDRSQDFGRFLLYQIEESRYAPGIAKHESPIGGDLMIIEEMRDAIVGGNNSVAIELLESGRYDVNYLQGKDSNFGRRMTKLLCSNNYECLDAFFNNGLKGGQFLSLRVLEDCYKAEGVDVHTLEDTWKEFIDSLKDLGYRWPFDLGRPVDDKIIDLEHLFVWSVVFRRHEIAKLIWAELDEPVAAALAVNKIQQLIISTKRIKDTEVLSKYEQYSNLSRIHPIYLVAE
ncbi:transient receptor potential cation channel subfamily M member 2 isoform X2 [Patella vulgata]|uniref:transient receptor potential cation channel subfamily M member 2 isoform X2 n=1 Tax=Patella vulgata TaxID=6465 RepID=UPI0024A97AE4|nr:transient receptor potential cation channel subfamily M member 2 isoform X2 [Patella vulgata]